MRHGPACMQTSIMIKTREERLGILHPKCGKKSLFLEIGIVGILLRELSHDIFLHFSTIASQCVMIVKHVRNRTCLSVFSHLLRLIQQLQHVLCPLTMEQGVAEQVQTFPCGLLFASKHGAASQVFLSLHMPAIFHPFLHADTMAVVQHAILIVSHTTKDVVHHIYRNRSIAILGGSRETVHFSQLST